MNIKVVENYEQLSHEAAQIVAQTIKLKKDSVLGLPTGGTPIGMYRELVQLYKQGIVDFSDVKTFNLDEYIGLEPSHPQSYHYYMQEHLFSHVNIPTSQRHLPRGNAVDLNVECEHYESLIQQAGGMDLVILGIGKNGHIGFNEPGSDPDAETSIVQLTQSTIKANSIYFESLVQVPKQAITMGLGTIIKKSKNILILASGEEKAEIIQQLLELKTHDIEIPASLLLHHQNVTLLIDEKAAMNVPKNQFVLK